MHLFTKSGQFREDDVIFFSISHISTTKEQNDRLESNILNFKILQIIYKFITANVKFIHHAN